MPDEQPMQPSQTVQAAEPMHSVEQMQAKSGHGAVDQLDPQRGSDETMAEKEPSALSIPPLMSALRLHEPGGPAELVLEQLETPRPGPGEALVRVHAAAITRNELDWPVDRLPATPSYEFAGVVAAVGPGVEEVAIGESVYALGDFDCDGAAADYAIVRADLLAPKPRTLEYIESAAVPLAALSAWQALFDHGNLSEGERVLIHGAAGGVGGFAVQLAHSRGAYVIGTASGGNVATARSLGADQVVDHTSTRFEDVVEEVDLVFDTVGGERLERSPAVVRRGGRLVSLAAEPPQERAAARGIAALYFVVEPNREQLIEVARLVDGGGLKVTIDAVFALADARAAFERSLGEHDGGKIVLRVANE
jgi:NADPH:quinone reductase-like Zn-dependent oxidoreductase